MKKSMKKMTGDSTLVSKVQKVLPTVQLKKASDHSTSKNKTNVFHKQPVPNYPYGQEFKATKAPEKTIAGMTPKGPVKKK